VSGNGEAPKCDVGQLDRGVVPTDVEVKTRMATARRPEPNVEILPILSQLDGFVTP